MKVSTFMLAGLVLVGAKESPEEEETTNQLRRRTNKLIDPKTVEYKHGSSKVTPVGVTAPLVNTKTNKDKPVVKNEAKTAVNPAVTNQVVKEQKPVVESLAKPKKIAEEVVPRPKPNVVKDRDDDPDNTQKANVKSPEKPKNTAEEIKPRPQPNVVKDRDDDSDNPQKMSKPNKVDVQTVGKTGNRRKFVSYRSSEWEQMWLENVDQWAEKKEICSQLLVGQAQIVHDFLAMICTRWAEPPHNSWCIIDDNFVPLWYNTENRVTFQLSFVRPNSIPKDHGVTENVPVTPGPEHDHLMSRFIFLDEVTGEKYVEYIEPLVSTLRFPLSRCLQPVPETEEYKYHYVMFRGWIIPPPNIRSKKALYFDAGATSWNIKGRGSPSLEYITHMWQRHGITFDQIQTFHAQTKPDAFYAEVPKEWQGKVHFRQCNVSSSAAEDSESTPFLPSFIDRHSNPDDYILFKMDVDDPKVEDGSIIAILEDPNTHVDEVVWEHHVKGNYLLAKEWSEAGVAADLTLRQSYEYFLRMREKGIRAHSWV